MKVRSSRSVIFFSAQPVDMESPPESVVITNDTPTTLTISGIKIQGGSSTDFTEATCKTRQPFHAGVP
jgi:hypothetical protein